MVARVCGARVARRGAASPKPTPRGSLKPGPPPKVVRGADVPSVAVKPQHSPPSPTCLTPPQTIQNPPSNDSEKVVHDADVLFVAVKPQYVSAVLAEARPHLRDRHVIVSIAAGITVEKVGRGRLGLGWFGGWWWLWGGGGCHVIVAIAAGITVETVGGGWGRLGGGLGKERAQRRKRAHLPTVSTAVPAPRLGHPPESLTRASARA